MTDAYTSALTGMDSGERRKFRRHAAHRPLLFFPTALGFTKKKSVIQVREISMGGAQGYSHQPMRVGRRIKLKMSSPFNPESMAAVPRQLHKCSNFWAKIVRQTGEQKDSSGKMRYGYAFSWDNDTSDGTIAWQGFLKPIMVLLLFFAGTANVFYLKANNVYYFWYDPILNIYSIIISFYILSRFVLALFYKPPADVGYLPSISVIIACKNEEDSIRRTIDCIYSSDYPKEKMQVITVNDGSSDSTLDRMRSAAEAHPNLLVIHFKKNLGKRHAMAVGAKRAKGEILVYIDSDSFVKRNTLRKIVQGFHDPDVGAVCGHALVANATRNMLTKMQQVRYFIAFRMLKASESLFWTVSCCSGCLAAYRRSYVMSILDHWLNQKFLGVQATFGDDRSLTNYMLRRYKVIYDSQAICETLVPEQYSVFFRQQLRWKKSWIRETWIASMFIWKRHPLAALFFYMGALFPVVAPIVVLNALFLPLVLSHAVSFLYIYGAVLMAFLYSLVYLGYHRDGLWLHGIMFSFFYMFVLVWQTYYAVFTVHRNHWGTR